MHFGREKFAGGDDDDAVVHTAKHQTVGEFFAFFFCGNQIADQKAEQKEQNHHSKRGESLQFCEN